MIEFKTDYENILVFANANLDGALGAFTLKNEYDNNLVDNTWEENVKVWLCDEKENYDLSWFKDKTRKYVAEILKQNKNAKFKVFMIGCSIQPNEDMIKFRNFLQDLNIPFVWCDSHSDAIENLLHYGFDGIQNTKDSSCINVWRYLKNDEAIPTLYEMLNDFNFGFMDDEYSWEDQILPVMLQIEPMIEDINDNHSSLIALVKSFLNDPDDMIRKMEAVKRSNQAITNARSEKIQKNIYEYELDGMQCLVVNALDMNLNEFKVHPKFNEADLLVRWNYDGQRYDYELFTFKDEVDIKEVCTKYLNGNGYRKYAHGFSNELIFSDKKPENV